MTLWTSSVEIFFCHWLMSFIGEHEQEAFCSCLKGCMVTCSAIFLMPLIYRAIVSRMSRIIRNSPFLFHYVLWTLDLQRWHLGQRSPVQRTIQRSEGQSGDRWKRPCRLVSFATSPMAKGHCLPTSSTEHARQSKNRLKSKNNPKTNIKQTAVLIKLANFIILILYLFCIPPESTK